MVREFFKNILLKIKEHKIIFSALILVIAGIVTWIFLAMNGKSGSVSYSTSTAEKGTIVTSVSGSGQVSPSSQIDLKAKASGDIIYVGVKSGQQVNKGALIAQLDSSDAQKSVRDAQQNLQTAKISYQKLVGPDSLSIPLNKQDAQDALKRDYESGYNTVADTFLDLPAIMIGLNNILYGNDFQKYQDNLDYYFNATDTFDQKIGALKNNVNKSYEEAKAAYDKNFSDYKETSRFSDQTTIDLIISETYETSKKIAQSIKDANNLIQFYKDTFTDRSIPPSSIADTHLSDLSSYLSKINSSLMGLLNSENTIKSDKTAIDNADLDMQSQQLSLQQKENSLADAKDNLANYYIYAPFSGIIADVPIEKGDSASNGTTLATIITKQSITEIPFNEVDITKIKIGQKAILTFDAIEELTVVGEVANIDTLGTVTQGVVNYNVEIVFDATETDVRPGMSVSANIITDSRQDVITVPNSAVKTQGNLKYVQVLVDGSAKQVIVETGLSNDTETEITSGLSGGEYVVTQTTTSSSKTSSNSTSQSGIGIPGIGGAGGVRIQTGGSFGR